MGSDDLHSIVFSNSSIFYDTVHSSSSSSSSSSYTPCNNTFHDSGDFVAHSSPIPHMDEADQYTRPPLPPSPSSIDDTCLRSTGYLEDVLSEYLICCNKRRRTTLLMFPSHHYQTQHTPSILQAAEEGISGNRLDYSSLSSSYKDHHFSDNSNSNNIITTHQKPIHPIFSSSGVDKGKKERVALAKVAYPFAMVKPGGCEGEVTLNDINERILMPPTRPVRHPVGDYACRPMVSPEGPGLSGKAVVAFTRIHTRGRGTITIVRTRGS